MHGPLSTIESNPGRAAVYLFEPARTQFDLNFNLFGIHVRVHPMFWVVTAILGSNQGAAKYVLLWMAVVFVSVLIHELGHVLMGRIFGADGHIVLYGFGGLAIGSSDLNRRWQRNFVYLAGPFAQFMLLGIVLGVLLINLANRKELSNVAWVLLWQLIWVNSVWPILNLLPIWPLDGGRISREFFEWLMREGGTATSLVVSMMVAGVLAAASLALRYLGGSILMGLWFAMFAVNNFQEWQLLRYRSRHPWDQGSDSW
jgi:Zn-dependent protease